MPQTGLLFGASVRENIAFGIAGLEELTVTQSEIEAAARLANAHEFITQLPDGYDTVLNEGGHSLSGGQRQRLAIARAALRQADLVLLDEPTSGLDNANVALVNQALWRLVQGRTCFWVSHDLDAVKQADLILYMADGRIVEQGTHRQLLARAGAYARSFHAQTADAGCAHSAWPSAKASATSANGANGANGANRATESPNYRHNHQDHDKEHAPCSTLATTT